MNPLTLISEMGCSSFHYEQEGNSTYIWPKFENLCVKCGLLLKKVYVQTHIVDF